MSRPLRISELHSERLRTHALCREYLPSDWRVFCTRSRRGRCRPKGKYVTVPAWAVCRGEDFTTYYLAHELAHIKGGLRHGKQFYDEFRQICPEHLQHFELKYKPRNAAAAGIRN